MERAEAEAIYDSGRETVVAVLLRMDEQIQQLTQQVAKQGEEIPELKRRTSARRALTSPGACLQPGRASNPTANNRGVFSSKNGAGKTWTEPRIKLMRYRVPVATQQKSRPARKSGTRGEDRRTTLRVPAALEAELSRTARSLGVSENEALVYLAQLGAEATDRYRARQRIIARHRKAISGLNGSTAGTFPSPQEAREAILADRG